MRERVDTYPGMKLQILDFTAAWCGPCKQLKPVLTALSTEYKADLVEIDVDVDPTQAQLYNVRAMPTVVLLRDGKEVGRFVGARNRAFVSGMLDRALNGDVAIASP
ncbi:MAG TPA: thioredoxin family protein [Kofleriaceae bacterium]|jgi:thioredoxin